MELKEVTQNPWNADGKIETVFSGVLNGNRVTI
jgi:hypothetical protein